jgi:hypothetical protein
MCAIWYAQYSYQPAAMVGSPTQIFNGIQWHAAPPSLLNENFAAMSVKLLSPGND